MKKFAILADAACDLTEEYREKYGIDVLPAHVVLPDKQEIFVMPNWDWCSCEDFYRNLKRNPTAYTTSPTNVSEFAAAMEEYAARGEDLLVLTISGGISGTVNFANQAKAIVLEKYPQAAILVVDSRRFGPGFGLIAIYAALCREKGMSLSETAEYVEQNKNRFHQAGWHDDLAFVAKKGRITHAKAFFGTLAGVKPIGEFDYNGLTTVIGKVKGTKAAYETLLSYIEATAEDIKDQIVFIAHTNRPKQAEEYKAMIEARFSPKEVHICHIHAFCGVNVGPGLMAAYYVGKPISEELSEERRLIEKLTKEEK